MNAWSCTTGADDEYYTELAYETKEKDSFRRTTTQVLTSQDGVSSVSSPLAAYMIRSLSRPDSVSDSERRFSTAEDRRHSKHADEVMVELPELKEMVSRSMKRAHLQSVRRLKWTRFNKA